MRYKMKKFILLLLTCSAIWSNSAEPAVEKWQGESLKLDGKLTETAWKKGAVFADFSPFASEKRTSTAVDTNFMLRCDKEHL